MGELTKSFSLLYLKLCIHNKESIFICILYFRRRFLTVRNGCSQIVVYHPEYTLLQRSRFHLEKAGARMLSRWLVRPVEKMMQAKLFERFYRRDEARSGDENHFGLGLSIAASIVSHHNGTIRVESHAGENRFIVALPASMSNYVNKK